MPLAKKQKSDLISMLSDLERVKHYIVKDSTVVACKTSITSMPENTYLNKKTGEQIVTFNKHIGTELCYLYNAIDKLKYIINPPVINQD